MKWKPVSSHRALQKGMPFDSRPSSQEPLTSHAPYELANLGKGLYRLSTLTSASAKHGQEVCLDPIGFPKMSRYLHAWTSY